MKHAIFLIYFDKYETSHLKMDLIKREKRGREREVSSNLTLIYFKIIFRGCMDRILSACQSINILILNNQQYINHIYYNKLTTSINNNIDNHVQVQHYSIQ